MMSRTTPILAAILLTACAGSYELPDDFAFEASHAVETAPLGGAALAHRERQLRRAYEDMVHFHATLESLHYRRDRNGLVLFSGFLDAYMGVHLMPLLTAAWQSDHPELAALDASLRFAQAEVLIQMRSPRRVQDVINEIESRYTGRGTMLVRFPIGGQTTLEQGLEMLGSRKWRG